MALSVGVASCGQSTAGSVPYWRPVNGWFVCTETPETSGDFAVSPNGSWLAVDGQVVNLRDNSTVALPDSFWPQGWLADDTLIGIIPSPHTAGTMGIIHLSNPQQVENWGFSGAFVGLVQ